MVKCDVIVLVLGFLSMCLICCLMLVLFLRVVVEERSLLLGVVF